MTAAEEEPSGLCFSEVLMVVLGSLLLTPMLGGAMALHWRQTRPIAGRQAMAIAGTLVVFLGTVWFVWVFRS